jgi:hypothetical protein
MPWKRQPSVKELSKHPDAMLARDAAYLIRRTVDAELCAEDRVVGPGDSDVDRSWRLALLAPRAPDPGHGHDNVGAKKALGTKGHLSCRALVDNGTRRHPECVEFHVGRIGDYPANEEAAGAGHFCERTRQQAAGQRFGCCDPEAGLDNQCRQIFQGSNFAGGHVARDRTGHGEFITRKAARQSRLRQERAPSG